MVTRWQVIKKISGNLIWLLFERGVQFAVAITSLSLISRFLGAEDYGRLQYAIAALQILIAVSLVAATEVVLPMAVQKFEQRAQLIWNIFFVRVCFAMFLMVCIGLTIPLWVSDAATRQLIYVVLIMVVLWEPFNAFLIYFQSVTHSRPAAILRLCASLCKVLWIITIFFFDIGSLLWVMYAYLLEYTLVAGGLWFLYWKTQPVIIQPLNLSLIRRVVIDSFKLWPSILLMCLFLKGDRLILDLYVTKSELGLYGATIALLESAFSISPLVIQSLVPILVYAVSPQKLRRNLIIGVAICFVLASTGALIVSLSAEYIVSIVLTDEFQVIIPWLKYGIWIAVLVFIEGFLASYFYRCRAYGWLAIKWLLAFCAMLLINVLFIPYWGITTPLFALAIGYLIACIESILVLPKLIRLLPVETTHQSHNINK